MFFLVGPALVVSCSSSETEPQRFEEIDNDGVVAGDGDGAATGGLAGDGDPAASGGTGTGGGTTATGGVVGSTGGTSSTTGGTTSTSTGGTVTSNCTDNLPTDTNSPGATCQDWSAWGECDSQWLIDQGACEESCGRCTGGATGGASGDGDGDATTGGSTGDGDVTLPPLEGGTSGWATRYWDCCKQSCGWSGNTSNPVDSCDINDNNIGVDDQAKSVCGDNGPAFTCHSFAPWAKSDTVSYGFAAYNDASCGTCFQIQFDGSGNEGQNNSAIAGKQMIVQVTNIGGIQPNQIDLLIPGGGVGQFDGCSTQWGVSNSELGEQYGGFRATCGDDANCVRNMCQNAFGDKPDLMAGCDWYIDWFHMADNPTLRYTEVACPQEIRDRSGG